MKLFRHKVYAAILRPLYAFMRSHFNASPASDGVTNVTLCSLFLSEPATLYETAALYTNAANFMNSDRTVGAFTVIPGILDFHLHEDSIRAFLLEAESLSGGNWDIMLLGAHSYGKLQQITRNVARIGGFAGPTAMLVRRGAAERYLAEYARCCNEGAVPLADVVWKRVLAQGPPLSIFAPPFPDLFCSIRQH